MSWKPEKRAETRPVGARILASVTAVCTHGAEPTMTSGGAWLRARFARARSRRPRRRTGCGWARGSKKQKAKKFRVSEVLQSTREIHLNDIVRILQAAEFAADAHAHQRRKGEKAEPYLNHLIEVAACRRCDRRRRRRRDRRPAARSIEDTTVTEADIEGRFGRPIAALVLELTDDKSLPTHERKDLKSPRLPVRAGRRQSSSSRTKPATCAPSLPALRRGPKTASAPMSNGRRMWSRACRTSPPGC